MNGPSPIYEFRLPTWKRNLDTGFSLFLWSLFAWIGLLCLFQKMLLPGWTYPDQAILAAIVGAPVAVLGTWGGYSRRIHAVLVQAEEVELIRGGKVDRIRRADVVGLVGQAGMSLDSWNPVIWKKLAIVGEAGVHTLSFDPVDLANLFESLREACPLAWGLRYPGELVPPITGAGSLTSGHSLRRLRRFYRGRVIKTTASALLVVVGCLAGAIAVVRYGDSIDEAGKTLFWLGAFGCAGGLLLFRLPQDLAILGQLRWAESSVTGKS